MYWLLSNHDDDSNGYIVDDEASVSSPVWFLAIPNGPETGNLSNKTLPIIWVWKNDPKIDASCTSITSFPLKMAHDGPCIPLAQTH